MNTGNVTVTEIDTTTLPEALLATAKTHLRVEFTRDDAYIKQAIGRAINLYEQFIGRTLFARTVEWVPTPLPLVQQVPFQPVSDMSAADADGNDISAEFELTDRGGAVFIVSTSKWAEGTKVTLETGYEDETKLPPGALDIVLRITAGLYENREHQSIVTMQMVSFWTQDLIVGGGWIPRA